MDIFTLNAANKNAEKLVAGLASGVKSHEVDNENGTITFHFNDGSETTMQVQTPQAKVEKAVNAYLAKNGLSGIWTENMCPNIYVHSNGIAQANGTKRDYNNTIAVLKALGVTKVSLLAAIATYDNNSFALATNVDYTDVVQVIHDAGMMIQSIRFSNSVYGKENMCDATKIADLATSIPTILSNLGIADEVEFVGILNETSVVYFDSTYTDAVIACIQSLQSSGYKVAITDNARFCMQIPDAILEALDYIGFNEYPILSTHDSNATTNEIAKAFDSYQIAMYADKLKAKGLKVYISEVGCTNQTNALSAPSSGSTGDYNGMTSILLEFKGFKKYLTDSSLNNTIETFNPWYTDVWESTDEMIELFGGAK